MTQRESEVQVVGVMRAAYVDPSLTRRVGIVFYEVDSHV
jgi:hypothetical protein